MASPSSPKPGEVRPRVEKLADDLIMMAIGGDVHARALMAEAVGAAVMLAPGNRTH